MVVHSFPTLIQGGMGAGVSSWRLARAVAAAGQLGVVAGTALDTILARRLQLGDAAGHVRRALDQLPIRGVARRILDRFYVPGGKSRDEPFKALPLLDADATREREELIVAANFVEVFLAKEGHEGLVGINYLEKIQLPTLPSLFGAMLAGVDFVLMGAGIPRAIPGVLDDLAAGRPTQLALDVEDAAAGSGHAVHFDPEAICTAGVPQLRRPRFLAIVASASVAMVMARKSTGRVDGLVIEGPTAGGHNAPPRGPLQLNDEGEPIFGDRDQPDLTAIAKLNLPFWLAGSYASAARLREALSLGASGIQVGTAFAFCAESGVEPELKRRVLDQVEAGTARVKTEPRVSPTEFPFKVLQVDGTLSEQAVFERRERVCDLGYLRHAYARADGRIGWRCPGEPVEIYVRKGGSREDAQGRKCVCNGLVATIGLAQTRRDGTVEPALLTSGADLRVVAELLERHGESYSAQHVIDALLGDSLATA